MAKKTPKIILRLSYVQPKAPNYLSNKPEEKRKYEARRKFFNMTSEYNYLEYILNGKKCVKNSTAEKYYEKNGTGLFHLKGEYSKEEKDRLKERLAKTKSTIWYGVVSFDQETSQQFTSTEQAREFMNHTISTLVEDSQLDKDNLEIYCALHVDRAHHHHIHYAFFEKKPLRLDAKGYPCYTKKCTLPQQCLDNYMISANMYLEKSGKEYHKARDRMLDRLKEMKGELVDPIRKNLRIEIALNRLSDKLPKGGRMAYGSRAYESYRKDIDDVVRLLIQSDIQAFEQHKKMLEQFARVDKRTRELANEGRLVIDEGDSIFGSSDFLTSRGKVRRSVVVDETTYFKKLKEDYRKRCGNIVLGLIGKRRAGAICEQKSRSFVSDKMRKIAVKKQERHRSVAMRCALKLLRYPMPVQTDFSKSVKEFENEIKWGVAK